MEAGHEQKLRIVEFAKSNIAKIFQDVIVDQETDISLSLAGGCFKILITGLPPRDFDIWPTTETDLEKLKYVLESNPGCCSFEAETPFNYAYKISAPLQSEVLNVEVVKKPNTLPNILAGFDIAISAVGVQVMIQFAYHSESGKASNAKGTSKVSDIQIESVSIHEDFGKSFAEKEPFLILPMPNPAFLLATAERIIRYADELKFPFPTKQLEHIQGNKWIKLDQEERDVQLRNYAATSHGGQFQRKVFEYFELHN